MKFNKILFVLAAIITGILMSTILLKRAGRLEANKEAREQSFISELGIQSNMLKEWENTTTGMELYPEQERIVKEAFYELKLVQHKIQSNASYKEVLSAQQIAMDKLKMASDVLDFNYINWKNSFTGFEDKIFVLSKKYKSTDIDYKYKLYSINTLRLRYLKLLLPK